VNTFTHVSASQLDAFADASAAPFVGGEGCNRAWWFEKILGIPKPPKVSADRGVLIHKRSEQYLKTGDPAHLADGLMLAKDLLPDPALLQQGRLKVEHPVSANVIDGVVLKGFVDIWRPWQIDDLKTSNDPRWFKTPEEIRSNLQMNIYGYINGITHGTGKYGTVRLAHIQLHVPRNTVTVVSAKRVEVEVPIDATRKVWTDRVVPLTRRMQEVALLDDPSRVTPNWSACSRYGGCPYQDRCAALKLAGAGGTARSPFAGMNATLSHPVPSDPVPSDPVPSEIGDAATEARREELLHLVYPKENTTMPPSPTAPRLPPALAAKVGQVIGASTPIAPASATPALTRAPNTTPPAASVATQARTTAAPSPATPRLPPGVRLPSNVPVTKVADVPVSSPPAPAARATGVVPPDAPNPRAAAPVQSQSQAQAPAPSTPAPDVEPAPVTDQQKEQALLALGWPEDVLSLMTAEVFEEAYEARLSFADVELVHGQDEDGQYVESFARKPPPAPAAPARRRRASEMTVISESGVTIREESFLPEKSVETPKSKGVSFGAPLAAQTARRPRDAAKRLATYGYADSVIAKMSTDTMKYLLDNEVPPTVVSILPDGSGVRFDIEPETAGSASSEETAEQHLDAGAPDEAAAAEIDEQADAVMGNDTPEDDGSVTTENPFTAEPGGIVQVEAPDPVFTADPMVGLPTSTKASREEAKQAEAVKTVLVREPYTTTPVRKSLSESLDEDVAKFRLKAGDLALYIDCVPTKGEAYTDFAEFIAPHVDAVAQAHGAENFYDLDKLFGRGPGMVAARLLLPANRPAGALVIDSRHPFAAACVADLQRFATRVVRAMR
jgi:hypothetical protein